MAVSKATRKFLVYRYLFRLNRAVLRFDWNLIRLMQQELLDRNQVETWQSRLGEIQAEINKSLTGKLHEQESRETRRLGSIVEELEESEIAKTTAKVVKSKAARKKR